MAESRQQQDFSTSKPTHTAYHTSTYLYPIPNPFHTYPPRAYDPTAAPFIQRNGFVKTPDEAVLHSGDVWDGQVDEEPSSSKQFDNASSPPLELSPMAGGEGRTLNLRELSHNELEDPKMKEFLKLSESLSLGPFFIATEEEDKDLTGTVIEDKHIPYRLQRLLSRGNDSDIYAVAVRMADSRWLESDSFHACAYTFHGVPKALADYRRRSMRRLTYDSSYIGPFRQNGMSFLLCMVDDGSDASNAVKMARENARIKQQKKRQRKRAQKREDLSKLDEADAKANSTTSQKGRKPSPAERSLRFLLGLYDFDNPQIESNAAKDENWEAVLNLSESVRRAKDDQVMNKRFEFVKDMKPFVKERRDELLFLKKQQLMLPKVQHMIRSRYKTTTGSVATPDTEVVKFEYASRLLPRLIEASEVCSRNLTNRLEMATRYSEEWRTSYWRLESWKSLRYDQERLSYNLTSLVRGSPAWNRANTELGIVQKKIKEMGSAPVNAAAVTRLRETMQKALNPLETSSPSDSSDGE